AHRRNRHFRWWGDMTRLGYGLTARRQLHSQTRARRFVQRVDDADVLRAFPARRNGLTIVPNALHEIADLAGELIVHPAGMPARLVADRQGVRQRRAV